MQTCWLYDCDCEVEDDEAATADEDAAWGGGVGGTAEELEPPLFGCWLLFLAANIAALCCCSRWMTCSCCICWAPNTCPPSAPPNALESAAASLYPSGGLNVAWSTNSIGGANFGLCKGAKSDYYFCLLTKWHLKPILNAEHIVLRDANKWMTFLCLVHLWVNDLWCFWWYTNIWNGFIQHIKYTHSTWRQFSFYLCAHNTF